MTESARRAAEKMDCPFTDFLLGDWGEKTKPWKLGGGWRSNFTRLLRLSAMCGTALIHCPVLE
jgi:hypothetical protein